MRGLRDFKVPDFKFPKFKMRDISEIEEMNMSNEEIEKQKEERKKDKKEYVATNYSDIKEIFEFVTSDTLYDQIGLISDLNRKTC